MSLVSIKIDDGNSNINYMYIAKKKNTVHPACVEITVRKFHDFVKIELFNWSQKLLEHFPAR